MLSSVLPVPEAAGSYLETSSGAVLGHNAHVRRVHAGADERVQIVMAKVPHLEAQGKSCYPHAAREKFG